MGSAQILYSPSAQPRQKDMQENYRSAPILLEKQKSLNGSILFHSQHGDLYILRNTLKVSQYKTCLIRSMPTYAHAREPAKQDVRSPVRASMPVVSERASVSSCQRTLDTPPLWVTALMVFLDCLGMTGLFNSHPMRQCNALSLISSRLSDYYRAQAKGCPTFRV